MFEEFYLQTQVGGLRYLYGSLLVNTARGIKNPGYNEARPFSIMCKHLRATLTPKKPQQEAAPSKEPTSFR